MQVKFKILNIEGKQVCANSEGQCWFLEGEKCRFYTRSAQVNYGVIQDSLESTLVPLKNCPLRPENQNWTY
jgi:hypothetical protein